MSKQNLNAKDLTPSENGFLTEMSKISGWPIDTCLSHLTPNKSKTYIEDGKLIAVDFELKLSDFSKPLPFHLLENLTQFQLINSDIPGLDLSALKLLTSFAARGLESHLELKLPSGLEEMIIVDSLPLRLLDLSELQWRPDLTVQFEDDANTTIITTECVYKGNSEIKHRRCNKKTVKSSSEELHNFAEENGWDEGIGLVKWIVNHENCDSGTALMLFWLADPEFFVQYRKRAQVSSWQEDKYSLLRRIEKLYLNKEFKSNKVQFDPRNNKWGDLTGKHPELNVERPISEELYAKTNG